MKAKKVRREPKFVHPGDALGKVGFSMVVLIAALAGLVPYVNGANLGRSVGHAAIALILCTLIGCILNIALALTSTPVLQSQLTPAPALPFSSAPIEGELLMPEEAAA
jgi:hypothetical protein